MPALCDRYSKAGYDHFTTMLEKGDDQDAVAAARRENVIRKFKQFEMTYKNIRRSVGLTDDADGEMLYRLQVSHQKNEDLMCALQEIGNMLDGLKRQLQCERDYNQSLRRMQVELEETRCNLQREMLTKKAESERTQIQMKNLQSQMGERLSEVEHLQACMEDMAMRNECEKEALKKVLKMQADKASRAEENLQKAYAKVGCLEDEMVKFTQDISSMDEELKRLRPEAQSKAELEQMCQKLQDHLKELQPVPELLKVTEMKFKEEQVKSMQNEGRCTEQARIISDISARIDEHNENAKKLAEEIKKMAEEKSELLHKVNSMSALYEQGETTIVELSAALQMKNDLINQMTCKLEDKDCNNLSINRQLEEALAESNRLSRLVEERALQLEKQNLGRLKDMETQLACSKQEIKQIKAEKRDLQCKYGRQTQDLQDKLERFDATTHTLQSYVSYLRTAYASVFTDPNLTSTCPSPGEGEDTNPTSTSTAPTGTPASS